MTKVQCCQFSRVKPTRASHYLSVANSQPKDTHKLGVFKGLVPDWESILNPYRMGHIGVETYTNRYLTQLDESKPRIREGLGRYLDAHDPKRQHTLVLVCWEGKDKFCHRTLAAQWLLKNCSDLFSNAVTTKRTA